MSQRPPILMLPFFAIFGIIGIAVLVNLWSADGFGEPPMFFKLIGSLIALAFICMGFGVPLQALFAKTDSSSARAESGGPARLGRGIAYECPSCGSGIGKDDEVSPSGDVKCDHCGQWWNIHRGGR